MKALHLNWKPLIERTIFLSIIIAIVFCGIVHASEYPQIGSQYKIIRPLYLMAVYDDLKERKLSKETARAYLHSKQYYNKAEVAFQCKVPAGTIMTIEGPAPKVWLIPFFANRYFIKLSPDLSHGLDVVLELNRGIEGTLDGLNPEIFVRP